MHRLLFVAFLAGSVSGCALAQISSDRDLLAEINRIKAVDNHTHVEKVVGPGEKDDDYDALPCYLLPPSPDSAMTRPDNPLFLEAWQNLYGYGHSDLSAEHLRELLGAKRHIESEQGDHYPAWILDKLGIEYMLANRIAMGRGLEPPRFLWVPYDDALLFPLNNQSMINTPDRRAFYPREEMLRKRYLSESGLSGMPATLDQYLEQVVRPRWNGRRRRAQSPSSLRWLICGRWILPKATKPRPEARFPATAKAACSRRPSIKTCRTFS